MFSSLAIVAAFVASVSAIAVTSPGDSKTWTNDGPQPITWTSVVTDPSNFTIVLTNDRSLMPTNNQILKALVPTSALSTTVEPPASGWPSVGGTYRINFCKDSESLDTILAQSDEFNITAAPVESTSASATGFKTATSTSTSTGASSGSTGSARSAGSADAGASSATNTGSASASTGTSAALPAMRVHTGFIGVLVLLGALLA